MEKAAGIGHTNTRVSWGNCQDLQQFLAGVYCCDFLTFAACLPRAVRVFFVKCFKVCFRFAALTAFLMFFFELPFVVCGLP